MIPWFLGIDLGTGSCKSVVIDGQGGVLGFGASEYGRESSQSQPVIPQKWTEQDPKGLLNGLFKAARLAIQAAEQHAGVQPAGCRAISLGCALHSLLALDRAGQPLTPIYTWADLRATAQAEAARHDPAADLYPLTGCPPHAMYPLYKILWLRQAHPEIYAAAARFVSAKEYAEQVLTGEWRVDYSLAAGGGMLNTHTLDWELQALALTGLDRSQLSRLCDPLEILPLQAEAAARLGLPAGTPVVAGSSDAVNSSLGAGCVQLARQVTCMVGTSGALRRMTGQPVLDPQERTWCYAIDGQHWLAGGSINNGGLALSWFKALLNGVLGPDALPLSFEDIMALAEQAGPGAGGVLCLPFLTGERSPHWNMHARGVFFGLTQEHDARHLARALVEGVAFRMRSVYDVLGEQRDPIEEVRASGGFTQSPLWIQTVASVLDRSLQVPVWGETSCLGAAMWGLRATEQVPSLEALEALVPIKECVASDPAAAERYQRLYKVYQHLYSALETSFYELSDLI